MDIEDYLLLRKGYIGKKKNEALLMRHQTALIVEALIGNGKGVRFVMDSWNLGEESQEMTPEQIKLALKKKREHDALKKIRNG